MRALAASTERYGVAARAGAGGSVRAMEDGHAERTQRVTPLELFFDLVFVFAITQVTGLMSE